tara:strand:- start:40 stop:1641 length:1602 start_codon:yes stop_codon:yes gene_type:complete
VNQKLNILLSECGSRNTHTSELYSKFCLINCLIEFAEEKNSIDKIIVDSWAEKEILKQYPNFKTIKIIVNRNTFFLIINNFCMTVLVMIKKFILKSLQLIIIKIFFNFKIEDTKNSINLIDTYIFPGAELKDHYYNGLEDHLKKEEKENLFFVPTIIMAKVKDIYSICNRLSNSERKILFKEQYITFLDILYSISYPLKIQFLKIKNIFSADQKIDYSPIFNYELRNWKGFPLSIEGCINYKFFEKLFYSNIKIRRVIDWWENQTIDKGFHLGLNKFFPEASVIGYLGYAPRDLELHLTSSKFELKNKVVPKEIAVIGKSFINKIKGLNNTQSVSVAPAFRYQHLWDDNKKSSQSNPYSVMIALSSRLSESKNILKMACNSLNNFKSEEIHVYIKSHPIINIKKLIKNINIKFPDNFVHSDLSTIQLLKKTNILITGMSSIGLEALAMGVPVLIIEQSEGLNYNAIPNEINEEIWKKCVTSEDVRKGIKLFINRNNKQLEQHNKLALQIRRNYFEPVTREGILELLDMNEKNN